MKDWPRVTGTLAGLCSGLRWRERSLPYFKNTLEIQLVSALSKATE